MHPSVHMTIIPLALLLLGNPVLPATDGAGPERETVYRSFEMRAIGSDPKADGETDFKGKAAIMSTDERIAFLNAYADYASAWFGVPNLDQKAVADGEVEKRLALLKPQPVSAIRAVLNLDAGWKQAASTTSEKEKRLRPWRNLPGAVLGDGELLLPKGTHPMLDLSRSTGWRYEVSWDIRRSEGASSVRWAFGGAEAQESTSLSEDGWHRFRLQVDLENSRAYLSRDGRSIANFPMPPPVEGKTNMFSIVADEAVSLRELTFIDYVDRRKLISDGREVVLPGGMPSPNKGDKQPYEPFVIADDDFREPPSLTDWNAPGYDDFGWTPAGLPCVHGGFRETGEDLYLRRTFELPEGKRFWLEVEALDPSGEIHLNGRLVARIPDRHPVFLDVTKFVKPGVNLLAVKVDHNWTRDLVGHAMLDRATGWFAGRARLHAIRRDAAIREMLVNTVSLGKQDDAKQTHRMIFSNDGDIPFEGTLEIEYRPWFPSEGEPVATVRVPVKIAAHDFARQSVDAIIRHSTPWSPERPFLYKVTATLRDDAGVPVDDMVISTGVRTVAQRDGKLLLNGQPALLIGAQNMGMRPYPFVENSSKYNRCATPEMLMSEILAIKNAGNNLFRVHVHSAMNKTGGINDPRIAEMADQVGLVLFWTGPAWIREGNERSIDTKNVGAYIRQVYNHPCIINWELSNHPNAFNRKNDSVSRTDEFVRITVGAVLAVDTSRLITPTTFWSHTHYGNDLGTLDWQMRPIVAVPEYTHPLVTRGSQDAITGYGAEWSGLRRWPSGKARDCLDNGVRAWFNFEHEESTAQPNWNLCPGYPWYHLRSYEVGYDAGSIGRTLRFDEWRASQGWQAFSCYESMRKQIFHGVAGFSWCTIEGGANGGTYEKPLLDPQGYAKLAWYVRQMLCRPVIVGSDDVDTVYGPSDKITPCVLNVGPARTVDLTVVVKSPTGQVSDTRNFPGLRLEQGRTLLKLAPFKPQFPSSGYCVVEYITIERSPDSP